MHLAAQAEALRAQKIQTQKMQARLHTVMQAREEEQSRDRKRIDLQTLQMEEARSAAAAAKAECEELRSTLAAERAEVARLREVQEYQYNEQQKERHDAMRSQSKLRAELKAAEARFAEERAEARAEVAVDSNHWQRECEKMCTLLAQAEVSTSTCSTSNQVIRVRTQRAPVNQRICRRRAFVAYRRRQNSSKRGRSAWFVRRSWVGLVSSTSSRQRLHPSFHPTVCDQCLTQGEYAGKTVTGPTVISTLVDEGMMRPFSLHRPYTPH